jgi:hypothetical protein
MVLNKKYTFRGFQVIEFQDRYRQKCSVQISGNCSLTSLWLGVDENRMLLEKKDLKELVKVLNLFIEKEKLFEGEHE